MADRTVVFYDSQCEICQAGISWLKFLDRHDRTECLPIDAGSIERAGLSLDACTQQLHIVTPRGVLAGWDAVAHLARLFPVTWPIGALGSVPPFRWAGRSLYGWVARNRYALSKCRGGACSVKVKELERHAPEDALRTCHRFGMLIDRKSV